MHWAGNYSPEADLLLLIQTIWLWRRISRLPPGYHPAGDDTGQRAGTGVLVRKECPECFKDERRVNLRMQDTDVGWKRSVAFDIDFLILHAQDVSVYVFSRPTAGFEGQRLADLDVDRAREEEAVDIDALSDPHELNPIDMQGLVPGPTDGVHLCFYSRVHR